MQATSGSERQARERYTSRKRLGRKSSERSEFEVQDEKFANI